MALSQALKLLSFCCRPFNRLDIKAHLCPETNILETVGEEKVHKSLDAPSDADKGGAACLRGTIGALLERLTSSQTSSFPCVMDFVSFGSTHISFSQDIK